MHGTQEGFVGAMLMGLTHTSGLGAMHCMGLTHTSSLNSREKSVGGGGCLECAVTRAARHTPT